MRVALGADHGGFDLKTDLAAWLRSRGYEVLDVGPAVCDAGDDYPDSAEAVARAVALKQAERGIIICGSGVGACVAANKVPGARASVCHDTYSAHQGVQHDDLNILCLGARIIGVELARELVDTFLKAQFDRKDRFVRRLQKVLAIEARALCGKSKRE
jgi:ribose 5-phosphate isomerase B